LSLQQGFWPAVLHQVKAGGRQLRAQNRAWASSVSACASLPVGGCCWFCLLFAEHRATDAAFKKLSSEKQAQEDCLTCSQALTSHK
jgi:hypothetical protein